MIRNCTPHPIVVRVNGIETVFQPSGCVPRVGTEEAPAAKVEGIPCVTQQMGACNGLPDPEPGVFLLVSALVLGSCDRDDLLAPDTGKTCIRDEAGRIVAVTRLLRREKKFDGHTDGVRVYNRALSAQEIMWLYVAPDLLDACKSILKDYGYDSSIRRQMEDVIAKAEGKK